MKTTLKIKLGLKYLCVLLYMGFSQMTNAAEVQFTTRSYIQGNDALTDLKISDEGYLLVMRGDVMDVGMSGAGIFAGRLSDSDRQGLNSAATEAKKYPGFTPAPLIDKYVRAFFESGERLAKLDATINLEPKDNKILVSVSFVNTGSKDICFKSPSTWEGYFNPINGSSWIRVSGILGGTQGKETGQRIQTAEFGGAEMFNAKDYVNDVICIARNEIKVAKFLVFPKGVIRKGTYTVGASIVIREVMEPKEFNHGLEFFSINQTIDFPRDYPSTPEEISAFAAYLKTQPQE
ncbi:hypothetical protein E2553_26695 [Paraburkholderia dipogonis]|uniref:Uncharacterized protein n=1 Tax=Paraburkholderia dipogonis TaxID=1211383 RepID=A0A4Y8MST8_9BURK|nr:hypothetical protein [Paraburkholderia dipogonis]TFE40363.1 hypothetical protein E2553_26695 [Paraburkholderia dipogonis]